MPYRLTPLVNDGFYHIFNRGVEKRNVFTDPRDYARFLQTLYYYQFSGPKPRFSNQKRFKKIDFENNPKIVEIVCYCLMPNHFHLLLKQLKNNGAREFLGKVMNSYTKYFNTKHTRVGPLFQGEFKAVAVESDEQLIHVSRYIHLNPYVADLTSDWENFSYSSYQEFAGLKTGSCITHHILDFFPSPKKYQEFIKDHASYALDIGYFSHLLIDPED